MDRMLGYQDITLVPRRVSEIESRKDVVPHVFFLGQTLTIPLIASPMPDVCGGLMSGWLAKYGAMGIIHRFNTIEQQVQEYQFAREVLIDGNGSLKHAYGRIACAVGLEDILERLTRLHADGCRIFCIDTANGAHRLVKKAILKIRGLGYDDIFLIAGNVATKEGFVFLQDLGVHAIRVGIAGGSVCTTRLETGVHVPMVTSIMECAEVKKGAYLIADGGIKTPADLAKAIAVGADIVMGGSIFAGTEETPGMVIRNRETDRRYKVYRGAASFGVQYELHKKKPLYNEGDESFVPYKGDVVNMLTRFENGLRSSMSYMNARTIEEFRNNAVIGYL